MASENTRSNSIVTPSNSASVMDSNNVPSNLFNTSHYRSYSPYQNNSFYLNASACSSMQYDPHIHAHSQTHHHHQGNLSNTQYASNSVPTSGQSSSLDYFRAIQSYGSAYSAFSRDIEHEGRKDGPLNDVKTSAESSKSQSSNDAVESSLQRERENVRTLILTSQQSDPLSDDIIEESFESEYDDENEDSTRTSQNKINRIIRPTTIYISPTTVLHSSVPNSDWVRAVSEHFQRSFALSKGNSENFFPRDDETTSPGEALNEQSNDHVNEPGSDDHSDSNGTTIIETSNVHSDKENESPSKLELTKNRPFQKRLERRRRRQQKRLELLYTPFRKRKLPANFFSPPSTQAPSTACYYSNPYSTYNAGSSSNYYNSSYNTTPSVEENPQGVSSENDVTPSLQYPSSGTFYESSAFYDPLNAHSLSNEQQSSVKVKTEIESNQLPNYCSNNSNSSSNANYSTKIRPTPLSLSVSMTIGGSSGANNNVGENTSNAFHQAHQSTPNQQQISQSPSGNVLHSQPHSHRSEPSSSSSSSAAAAAAAALATLNNDLTLDMSIHISPLTLANHHSHHGTQHQAGYGVSNPSHHQSYHSPHLCHQQAPQQSQTSQTVSQQANNLSGLFQESHTYYYHHHQSSNSGAAHYQYATKSTATESTNAGQPYSFGYYSAASAANAANNAVTAAAVTNVPGSTSNQQSVIYPSEYSSMSRLHQQTPSITTLNTTNVPTAAHIFSSLYSLAGQAGN